MQTLFTLIVSILIAPSVYAAKVVKLDLANGKSQFTAVGNPGFLKINGKGDGPTGSLTITNNKLNGKIEVNLESLDTGMSLRNRHMKEKYLKTKDNPKAVLIFEDAKLSHAFPSNKEKLENQNVMAVLNINNAKKPVTVSYTLKNDSQLEAKFNIKITDFDIEIPSFMNVTVADNVDVEITTELQTKSE